MNDRRPPPRTSLTWMQIVLEVVAAAVLVYGIAMFLLYYPELPETALGTAGPGDTWHPESLLVTFLAFNVGMYLLFTVLPRIPRLFRYPARMSRENAGRTYIMARKLIIWAKAASVGVWTYAIYFIIRLAPTGTERVNWLVLSMFMAILLGAPTYYLAQVIRAAK